MATCMRMLSSFFSGTVRPNLSNTPATTIIFLASPLGDHDVLSAPSTYSIHTPTPIFLLRASPSAFPSPFPLAQRRKGLCHTRQPISGLPSVLKFRSSSPCSTTRTCAKKRSTQGGEIVHSHGEKRLVSRKRTAVSPRPVKNV